MRIDEFCFVCVPFISEVGTLHKKLDRGVDYPVLNMMACNGVKQTGFTPASPIRLWDYYCLDDIYGRYDKELIIRCGLRLIERCDCFYFCDCEYDAKAHDEMEFWRIKAQVLNKEFVTINERFLK